MKNLVFFRQLRDVALGVLLLSVPFFFLRASIQRPEETNVVDRAVMQVAGIPLMAVAWVSRTVSGVVSQYFYLVDVKADNDKLASENALLRGSERKIVGLQTENQQLRRLLGLRGTIPTETVSASVVGKKTTEYFRVWSVMLDKSSPRIQKNMPVIAADGAVGTVLRTAGDQVYVQLTVDAGFGVDVVVERTGARGIVRGVADDKRYLVRVEYMQRTDEVSVGDLLVTSGIGCRFPKGVPVARVTNVIKRDFGIYQAVEATPTVDFSRVEHVLVVITDDTQDCRALLRRTGRQPATP